MKRSLIATLIFGLAANSYAATWSPALTVESTFTEGSTDIIGISTVGAGQLTEGCVANRWIFKADSEARRSRAFSVVMAAIASGKKVSLWYNTETCSSWNYHEATSIKFIN